PDPAADPVDRPDAPAAIAATSAPTAADHRAHPLARPATVAARCDIPAPRRAGTETRGRSMSRTIDRAGTGIVPDGLVERAAERIMLAAARRIRVGRLVVVSPDGQRRVFRDPASSEVGEMRIHDRSAIVRMVVGGDTGAGEAYMDGGWSSPDLPALLRVAARNRDDLALAGGWWRLPMRVQRTLLHRARRNTKGGSRRNI